MQPLNHTNKACQQMCCWCAIRVSDWAMDGGSHYSIKGSPSTFWLSAFLPCVTGGPVKLWESSACAAAFHDGWDVCVHVSLSDHSHRWLSQGNSHAAAGRWPPVTEIALQWGGLMTRHMIFSSPFPRVSFFALWRRAGLARFGVLLLVPLLRAACLPGFAWDMTCLCPYDWLLNK